MGNHAEPVGQSGMAAAPRGRSSALPCLVAAGSLTVLGCGPSRAEFSADLVGRLDDHQTTLQLERELADLLAGGDRAALRRFGQGVRRDGGGAMHDFAKRVQTRDKDALAVYVTLNRCQKAGMTMRLTAMVIAEGKVRTVQRGKAFVTQPSNVGEALGGEISSCEVLRRLPLSERRIGTNCLHTGQDCQ